MHTVYRHFDQEGKLLYAGRSSNPFARLHGHKRSSEWFTAVAKITMERCRSKKASMARERAIVRRERPLFNTITFPIKRQLKKARLLKLKQASPLVEDALAQFRAWGAAGGRAKAKKYTSKQISNMAKRGKRKKRNGA